MAEKLFNCALKNGRIAVSTERVSPCAVMLLLLAGMHTQVVAVPVPPNAGALLQQYQQQKPSVPPPRSDVLPSTVAPGKGAAPSTVRVKVTQFVFVGNTQIKSDRLAAVVAKYLNHPITMDELQQAVTAVAEEYRKEGWVVHVYLPRQDVTHGAVTIRIDEARFGGAKIDGPGPRRLEANSVVKRINDALPPGQLLNTNWLERPLLLINDLPGVAVSGGLQAGEKQNTTDLLIKFTEDTLFNGGVTVNNAGMNSTGSNQALTDLYLNSPLRIGDQLSTNIIKARGSNYGQLGYSLPVGEQGARVGVNSSWMTYQWKVGALEELDGSGNSVTGGINVSYPLIRANSGSLYISGRYNRESFYNKTRFGVSSDYDINKMVFSLYGNHQGLWDGITTGGIMLTRGRIKLNESNIDELPRGNYNKARYYMNRQQPLLNWLSLDLAYSGQFVNTNLDSSELFYLGGMNGVRAYPTGEAGGSEGQIFNAELRVQLPYQFSTSLFYDWGRTIQLVHEKRNAPHNRYNLQGYGLSLSKATEFGLNLEAIWSHRIGSNPDKTATGKDQDGTLKINRWWLQASWAF